VVKFRPKKTEDVESETESEEGTESAVESETAGATDAHFEEKAGIRVLGDIEGHEEASFYDMVGSEPIRLLFRGLAVARLNGDASLENLMLSRLAAVYDGFQCRTLADLVLDQLLEKLPLEKAGSDVLLLVVNRLLKHAEEHDAAGEAEQAIATREETLQVFNFILRTDEGSALVEELRGEKANLLEAVGRREEARQEYLSTIEFLERTRGWIRDPENKRGLQAHRWRYYVRGARNALRMHAADSTREDLLVEVWQLTQAGRSRALLDSIGAEGDTETDGEGVASVRPRSFSDVASRLPRDVAVLEYFLMPTTPGCAGSWAMMVVESGASAPWLAWQEPDMERVLEAKNSVTNLADEYERNIVHYGWSPLFESIEQRYIAALEKLADAILPTDLLDQLCERGYRKLVIVADSYLHEVPFAVLRPFQGGRRVYLGLPNEGRGFQVMYAPSSSIFAHWIGIAPARTLHARRAALFVDPLGDLSKANSVVVPTFNSIGNFLREHRVATKRFDGTRATPRAWIDEVRSHDLVVYFGHSVAGHGDPDRAALLLNDGSGSPAPMSASDVYRESSGKSLFSEHSLIVFASCSGGRAFQGSWDSDRELTGLSIAHLHAGCGAAIAASRPLLDAPTLILLETFLERILKGDDAMISLTEAQREMAESQTPYRHPHFWGYFGVMGVPHWRFYDGQG
jgi:CHAT domain-containing protein